MTTNPIQENNFLGTGWGFPPSFSLGDGETIMVTGEQDIKESLFILLSTAPGENLLHPDYGCPLHLLVFNPVNAALHSRIKDMIETAILRFEPRITVEKISIQQSSFFEGRLDIELEYTIITTNTRTNMVYPFYLR